MGWQHGLPSTQRATRKELPKRWTANHNPWNTQVAVPSDSTRTHIRGVGYGNSRILPNFLELGSSSPPYCTVLNSWRQQSGVYRKTWVVLREQSWRAIAEFLISYRTLQALPAISIQTAFTTACRSDKLRVSSQFRCKRSRTGSLTPH